MTKILDFPNRKKSQRVQKAAVGYSEHTNAKKEIERKVLIVFDDGKEYNMSLELAMQLHDALVKCILHMLPEDEEEREEFFNLLEGKEEKE